MKSTNLSMKFPLNLTKLVTWQGAFLVLTVDSMLSKLEKNRKEIDCQTLPRQCSKILQNSHFAEKSARYSKPVGQRRMLQGHVDDYLCSQVSLSCLQFRKILALYFLIVQILFYPSKKKLAKETQNL